MFDAPSQVHREPFWWFETMKRGRNLNGYTLHTSHFFHHRRIVNERIIYRDLSVISLCSSDDEEEEDVSALKRAARAWNSLSHHQQRAWKLRANRLNN